MNAILEARSRYRRPEDIDPITAGADEPEFDAAQAQAMVDKILTLGNVRKDELDKVIKQNGNGNYYIPHSSKGQYSDFYDQSNYEYLEKKYPWLHKFDQQIGINDTEAEESHHDLETYLASIPHEDWSNFITDMQGLDDYPLLDEERASELEMEEQGRWMTEDGAPDLIKEMVEQAGDAYHAYLLTKVTPDLVWEWCRETDHYPESQGEGSVWMDMKRLGALEETQDWFLEHLEDDVAGWEAAKRATYDETDLGAAGRLFLGVELGPNGAANTKSAGQMFDEMLRRLAGEDEQIAHVYNQLDAAQHWKLFKEAFPDEMRGEGDPYWYYWQPYSPPEGKPKGVWRVGYIFENNYGYHDWWRGYGEALKYLAEQEWFHRLVKNWLSRGPEDHPEFKFEHLHEARPKKPVAPQDNPDDPGIYLTYGGGVREKLLYQDAKITVMVPQDVETLNYHLRKAGLPEIDKQRWDMSFKYADVFCITGKESPDMLGHAGSKELGTVVGGDYVLRHYWNGNFLTLDNLLNDPEYGKNIKHMLLKYYRQEANRDEKAGRVLMQIGGVKELRRADRHGHLSLSSYGVAIGLHYAERGQLRRAAAAFGRDPETLTKGGVWLRYDDVHDLKEVFKNPQAAETVFNSDHYDWFDHYWEKHNTPSVDDVIPFFDQRTIDHIRSVMVNRKVWFPDAGPNQEGAFVLLTANEIKKYDDATIIGWLEDLNPEDEEAGTFEDIIEAIQDAGRDILSSASQDNVYTGYIKAAVNAIDGTAHKWVDHPKKKGADMFAVFVPWKAVKDAVEKYQDENNEQYDGALEDLMVAVNRETTEVDTDHLEASWRDVDKNYAAENLHRIHDLEPPEPPEPDPIEPGQVPLPLGEDAEDDEIAALKKKYGIGEPDYDLAKAEQEADALGHTQKAALGVARRFLSKSRHEDLEDTDRPEAMPQMLSGIPVEFEKQVKHILTDSAELAGYQVRDLKLHFDSSPEYSEEEIDASDGRLYNNPTHQVLLVTYAAEPRPDWSVAQEVFAKIKAAVVNTFRNFELGQNYMLNPESASLPEDFTIFQFSLYPLPTAPQPGPAEEIPF